MATVVQDPFGTAALRRRVLEAWTASPARFREDAAGVESLSTLRASSKRDDRSVRARRGGSPPPLRPSTGLARGPADELVAETLREP